MAGSIQPAWEGQLGVLRKLLHSRGLAAKRREVAAEGTPRAYADLARSYAAMKTTTRCPGWRKKDFSVFRDATNCTDSGANARTAILGDRIRSLARGV